MQSSDLLQNLSVGPVVAQIKGSVKKLGEKYQNATVVVYNKANLQPIAIRKPDADGNYQFLGLNTDLKTFIVAFDKNQQFNAVIQYNVRPK
ncbi:MULTISPECIES: hypothetical protein [Acinetobacter]|jgi:hypothetical protein|uniref:hypothetical protein n=1 Tax=Acinetobacter TaxID=469 RepID=UPI00049EC121|nr:MULTISPECIES: hypothetical protein [Acinetobacter]KCX37128.1 hypothetical protein J577_1904 [Acinetobacter sp. 263903-1]MCM1935869.1 hypothetical protein [Acinetobacter radioresistens]MCM1953738.1 hypothetical protein [Acinetobacter radioresistens]MCU4310204.1 hypothetical protein [Acinetobacter radioresistens]MCU4568562.1 hypothetical protein [Acinetobacter radioresistens]